MPTSPGLSSTANNARATCRTALGFFEWASLKWPADQFMTVAEVAETFKVAGQTVRNWIDRGELTAVRVGSRRVRTGRDDLDAFLAGQDAGSRRPRRLDRVDALERRVAELEARLTALERFG